MLLHLSVENFILIPKLEIDFHKGFTCITGETGAGKSILVGALSLILGQRADTTVLREKDKKCIVEGSFAISGYNLDDIFLANDLDFEPISVFRREINPLGKSRAFINDTPVNITVLKEIGEKLVDIHSQHQTLELNEASFQLAMVDSYAENNYNLLKFNQLYIQYNKLKSELNSCIEQEQKSTVERDYFNFQFEELENASLAENEQAEAENELDLLTHAEEIKTKTYASLAILNDQEGNVIDKLAEIRQLLEQVSRYSHVFVPLTDRVNQNIIELKDIAQELSHLSEEAHYDPERIEKLTGRLNLIYHLHQKHRVQSIEELLLIKNELSDKLFSIQSLADRIENIKNQLVTLETELNSLSVVLNKRRNVVLKRIEAEMHHVLGNLGMVSARFSIRMETLDHYSPTGTDRITFLFAANKGSEMREIQKVASGGELSRLMLAIKSLVLNRSMLPTILFDEIDSGVSGEIAGKVGSIMRNMSENIQVIAITHLPQIASKAESHFLAYKLDGLATTTSGLKKLSDDERVIEVARLLSDETITESAKDTAKELLKYRN